MNKIINRIVVWHDDSYHYPHKVIMGVNGTITEAYIMHNELEIRKDAKFIMKYSGVSDEDGDPICDGSVISMREKHNNIFDIIRYAIVEYSPEDGAFFLCYYHFDEKYHEETKQYYWKHGDLSVENFEHWRDFDTGGGIKVVGSKFDDARTLIETFSLIYTGEE